MNNNKNKLNNKKSWLFKLMPNTNLAYFFIIFASYLIIQLIFYTIHGFHCTF